MKEFDYSARETTNQKERKSDEVGSASSRDPLEAVRAALHDAGQRLPILLAELRGTSPGGYRDAMQALDVGPLGTLRLEKQIELLSAAADHDIAAELRRRRARSHALNPALRHNAEKSLGVSLEHVQVFEGPAADQMARGFGAAAFAHGPSIVLGAGVRNEPNTIMAEEVAHVTQQRHATSGNTAVTSPNSMAERSARRATSSILAGRKANVGSVGTRSVMRVERGSVSEEERNPRDLSPQYGSMESRSEDELQAIVNDEKGRPRFTKRGYLYEPGNAGAVTLELWLAAFDELEKRSRGPRGKDDKPEGDGRAHRAQGESYAPDESTPVQRKGGGIPRGVNVQRVARSGVAGAGRPLPYLKQLQRSFGRHDLAGVRAHVGGSAVLASQNLRARAYAIGENVAFAQTPDLHTAAHEAAHVVQQRRGVQLPGGLSRKGDAYEVHANAVADAVVAGRSAQGLLDGLAARGATQVVQRDEGDAKTDGPALTLPAGKNIEVRGTRGNPSVVLRKQWLKDNGAADGDKSVTNKTVMRAIISAINTKYKFAFDKATLDYAVTQVALYIGGTLGKEDEIFEAPIGRSLFAATGLPPGTDISVLASRKRPKKGPPTAHVAVLIRHKILVEAGLKPGAAHFKSATLSARIVSAVEKKLGLKMIAAQSENFTSQAIQTKWFRKTHPPGTWILDLNWKYLSDVFGADAMAEYAGDEKEGKSSLADSGLLRGAGVSQKDAEWVLAFLKKHFGGGPDGATGGISEIDRFLVESLRKLDKHPKRDEILAQLKGDGSGESRGLSAVSIDNAIHRYDLAQSREAAGLDKKDPPPEEGGRRPIVNTPVEGQMVSFSEPLVPNKEAKFWFQTRRLKDSFRHAAAYTEWRAWDEKGQLIDEDTTNHAEDNTNDTFDVEFDKPGKYKIYAYVRHTYYLDNDFTKIWEVKTEDAVSKDQEDREFGELGGRPDKTETHWFDAGLDNAILSPSYAKGSKGTGKTPEDFFSDYDEQDDVNLVRGSIANIDELIRRYKGSKDPTERAIAERAEKTKEQMADLVGELDGAAKNPHNVFFKVRGQYTSRTPGLRSGPMSLIGAYNAQNKKVVLKDYTLIVDGEVIEGTGSEGDFAGSLEEAFVDLCKSYPDGLMSIVAEQLNDHGVSTAKTLYFKLKTDSFWKDFKGTVFDPAVDIVVNVAGAVLLAFPPTSAVGAGILIGYNSVKTAAQLADWADKGTLTGEKVSIALGQLLVDVLPVLGRAKTITTLGGKAAFLFKAGELTGQALIITAQAKQAIARLRDGMVRELAQIEKEILTLQATRPWDPRLTTLKARKKKLIEKFRTTASDVISDLASRGLIIVAGSVFASTLANKALRKSYLRLVDDGVVTKVAGQGPPIRYNPETGKVEVNPAKEADISEAMLDGALAARQRDLALAKAVPDLATRTQLRKVLGTDDIEVKLGASESKVVKAGEKTTVHVKDGDSVLDVLAGAEVQARTAPRIKELSEAGAFKHQAGKEARYDPETGQIIGDRTKISPEKLAELDKLFKADMAIWQGKFAAELGVSKVEIQRGGTSAAARFDGTTAKVRIPKGKSIKDAFAELAAANKARKPAPEAAGSGPSPGKVQPEAPKADAPKVPDAPKAADVPTPARTPEAPGAAPKPTYEGTKDIGIVTTNNNVIVGDKLPDASTGHALLQKLAGGDQGALGAVGVGKLPDKFPANGTEWGLGRTPDGKHIVVKGETLGVDWGVPALKDVTALAHSHPYLPTNKLTAPNGGAAGRGFTLDELKANPKGHAANTIHLVPSGRDVVFCAQNGLGSHKVHTPFRHEGGGRVRNPTGPGDAAPTVTFDIGGAKRIAGHKDLDNLSLYSAKLTASAGGKEIWSGEVYASRWELDGGRALEEASLIKPEGFVEGPAPGRTPAAKTDAGTAPPAPTPTRVGGPDVKPRADVRDVPTTIRARSGVEVEVPIAGNTGLEHVARSHTIEGFDPVARAAEPKFSGYPPNHKTSFFRKGTATNPRELYTLIRQALEGKAGRGIKAGQNNKIMLTIRGHKVEIWVGAGPGGAGLRVNSIYPKSKNTLTKAEIQQYALDVIHGRKTRQEIRNELAARFE